MMLEDQCDIFNYADDNSLSFHHRNPVILQRTLESACSSAITWFRSNHMKANPEKFQAIVLSRRSGNNSPRLEFNIDGAVIKPEQCVKLLGVMLDEKLTFNNHISNICKKTSKQVGALRRIAPLLTRDIKLKLHETFVLSNLLYCSAVWFECSKRSRWKLEKIHERAFRVATNNATATYKDLLLEHNTSTLYVQHMKTLLEFVYKVKHSMAPPIDCDFFKTCERIHNLRDSDNLSKPNFSTMTFGYHSLRYQGPHLWNKLPNHVKKDNTNFPMFKAKLKLWTPSCTCGSCFLCLM